MWLSFCGSSTIERSSTIRPIDWWDDLLPAQPHTHPPGAEEMLRLIAYDIAHPRRLKRVAEVCLDFGVRVQKSVFECWLDDDRFEQLWERLQDKINLEEDQILAYTLDAGAARRRRTAGGKCTVTEKRSHYVL
jgi:CRISPR-associated protein Cas2